MNKRFISVLVFALIVSAAASYILYRLVSAQMIASQKNSGTRVLVAAHNLDTGALIKDGDVKMADWGGAMPVGAQTKPDDVIGRGVAQPILDGEPIMDSRIAAI